MVTTAVAADRIFHGFSKPVFILPELPTIRFGLRAFLSILPGVRPQFLLVRMDLLPRRPRP
jgi:hypothetical protein